MDCVEFKSTASFLDHKIKLFQNADNFREDLFKPYQFFSDNANTMVEFSSNWFNGEEMSSNIKRVTYNEMTYCRGFADVPLYPKKDQKTTEELVPKKISYDLQNEVKQMLGQYRCRELHELVVTPKPMHGNTVGVMNYSNVTTLAMAGYSGSAFHENKVQYNAKNAITDIVGVTNEKFAKRKDIMLISGKTQVSKEAFTKLQRMNEVRTKVQAWLNERCPNISPQSKVASKLELLRIKPYKKALILSRGKVADVRLSTLIRESKEKARSMAKRPLICNPTEEEPSSDVRRSSRIATLIGPKISTSRDVQPTSIILESAGSSDHNHSTVIATSRYGRTRRILNFSNL